MVHTNRRVLRTTSSAVNSPPSTDSAHKGTGASTGRCTTRLKGCTTLQKVPNRHSAPTSAHRPRVGQRTRQPNPKFSSKPGGTSHNTVEVRHSLNRISLTVSCLHSISRKTSAVIVQSGTRLRGLSLRRPRCTYPSSHHTAPSSRSSWRDIH